MTEDQWLACTDPAPMLALLRASGRASERKVRLFICACWRPRLRVVVEPQALRRDIEVVEAGRYGEATPMRFYPTYRDAWRAARASSQVGIRAATRRPPEPGLGAAPQAALLRDLFGPLPFREVHIDPSWLACNGGTVVKLAQAAYDERELPAGTLDPERLAVLADALDEAGCNNKEMLAHLRRPDRFHVQGCWCIDLLLGKS